jgi:hypothetical protein
MVSQTCFFFAGLVFSRWLPPRLRQGTTVVVVYEGIVTQVINIDHVVVGQGLLK